MPLTVEELIEGARESRRHFLKHLSGLTDEQWGWKPYPECKSITETLAHLIVDDRAALQSLQSGHEPDYEGLGVTETDRAALLRMLNESHEALMAYLTDTHAGAELDTPVCLWGFGMPLGRAIPFLATEDSYHAGQVSFIRLATDPAWDYYNAIYHRSLRDTATCRIFPGSARTGIRPSGGRVCRGRFAAMPARRRRY